MNNFKKSDLKTGHILTFSPNLQGVVIKDINNDPAESLILYLRDEDGEIKCYDYIDKILDDDLHCYKTAFDGMRDLISVEELKYGGDLGYLLSRVNEDGYPTVALDSVPKVFLLNRNRTLRIGTKFYIIKFSGNGIGDYDIGDYTIKDIYVKDNTTFLITTSNQKVDAKDVYFTKVEAEEALKNKTKVKIHLI